MSRKPIPSKKSDDKIVIRGARTHNLKNIDVVIPRGEFVVFSGVSGSGKSSLAFDTLYAEGQRRYVESLSSYARQFLGQMKKADCDSIEGLSPAISIDQKQGSHNPRSTVATVTEIMDYLRLLWARIGVPHCPECGKEVARRTVQEIVDDILWRFESHSIIVWSPIVRNKKGTHLDLFRQLIQNGYLVGKVNGREADFEKPPTLEKNLRHDIDVRIDRFILSSKNKQRLTEAVESGLQLGGGVIATESISLPEKGVKFTEGSLASKTKKGAIIAYSEEFACPEHGSFLPEMSPRIFSFNSPLGACPDCQGLGVKKQLSEELIITKSRSINEGCIKPFQRSMNAGWYRSLMRQVAEYHGVDPDIPFSEIDTKNQQILLYGTGSLEIDFIFESKRKGSRYEMRRTWEGAIPRLERQFKETDSDGTRNRIAKFMIDEICPTCNGEKLNAASRKVMVGEVTLPELNELTVKSALKLVEKWSTGSLDQKSLFIGQEVIKEILNRLNFLNSVGLEYLTLNRRANTLSGGESQRIRLATQIGSKLTGVMYVLDEPTIGLHQRDNQKLISTLRELTDLGNTLIVVEHDEETLTQADYIVDIGPGAGIDGGEIVVAGTPKQVMKSKKSITGMYLSGKRKIMFPTTRTKPSEKWLIIHGAKENNLKNIDVKIPLGCMTSITGVSGSGKSSLISQILAPALLRKIHNSDATPGSHTSISGLENVDKAIIIDQSPIGRTPRSNPATYTKVFDDIRKLFSESQISQERGYNPGHFSFNVKGGRCEACKGAGSIKLEMNFLPDVWIICDVCKGQRYNRETLEATWKGKTIHDILEMPVSEAMEFFKNHKKIHRTLSTLNQVGLGYIRLGQPATTLSGGEAQRVKLASELKRPPHKHTVYILDEPTTGLSLFDVEQLVSVLLELRAVGHSVIVIEHHLDVIKCSDWIIDLGPEGGELGGEVLISGTPEQVMKHKKSYTGAALKQPLIQSQNK